MQWPMSVKAQAFTGESERSILESILDWRKGEENVQMLCITFQQSYDDDIVATVFYEEVQV